MPIRWGDGEDGLRKMCDYGAAKVSAGEADALRFDVFGDERHFVTYYMSERHPEVPYYCTWPTPGGTKCGT